jgi:hypothetical protein
MPIDIFDFDQGSYEWRTARLGIPTSSMFSAILAKGEGKTRRSYMLKLAGEVLTGEPTEDFSTPAMERGKEMEPKARDLYAFMTDVDPLQVGFIRNGNKGCSPDSLIGASGMLEIKTKRSDLLIDVLLRDEFPAEHKAQCQGALWVAEREWIDIAVYWPKLPLFVKRAFRDEPYISAMSRAVAQFNEELAETVEKVRRYGQPSQVAA